LAHRPFSPSGGISATVARDSRELLLGIFLIVPLAGNPDTDTPRHTADTAAPDVLVYTSILTSVVPIAFCANFLISLIVLGLLVEGAAANHDERQLLITD
jgi:hypothetical protein